MAAELQGIATDELVKRCQDQDRTAQAEFYGRYKHDVARTAYRILGPDADLEDVVHDVFVEVFRSIDRFKGHAKVTTWLYRVSVNVALQHLRRRKRAPELARDELREMPDFETPLRQVEREEKSRVVYAVLDTLSEKKRTVFVMHDIVGESAGTIAEMLGVNVLTVRTRLHYARKEFYKKMLSTELYKGDEP